MVTLQVPPAPLLLLDTVLTEQSCGYSQNPSNQARAVSSPPLSRPGVTMFCTEMPAENSEPAGCRGFRELGSAVTHLPAHMPVQSAYCVKAGRVPH